MPVDQGGLRYNLEVTDNFSAATTKFREEMVAAKGALNSFRNDLSSFKSASADSRKSMDRLASGQRELNTALFGLTSKVNKYKTAVKGAVTQERALVREQKKSLQQSKAFSKSRTRQVAALKAQARVAGKLATATRSLAKASATSLKNAKLQVANTRKVIAASKLARTTYIKEAAALRKLTRQRLADARAASRQARAIGAVQSKLAGTQARRAAAGTSGTVDPRATARLNKADKAFNRVRGSSSRATKSVGGFQRVFTRLISAFVFFAAARGVVNAFKAMVSSAIKFNSVIEQSTLGIASLIVAVGEVRDATGSATTSAQQLALAQVEARKQVALLRKEGLRTAATFAQLTQTFQTAVAPGLQAGLSLDEIRGLTVSISQAAAAIGLPQEQLAEEIRSLLTGAITPRQTRIATSLGITNQDIAQFKELGTLAEELETRFEAFAVAGEQALDTFQARVTNTADAIQQLLAEGGLGFFNEIKELLGDVQNSIVEITDQGLLINPAAVTVAREFFKGLQSAVAEARKLGSELQLSDFAQVARVAGQSIAAVARIVAAIVKGFVKGLSAVAQIFQAVQKRIQQISNSSADIISLDNITEAVALVIEFSTVFGAVLIAAKALGALFKLVLLPVKAVSLTLGLVSSSLAVISGTVSAIGVVFGLILSPIGLIIAAVVAIGVILDQWLQDTTGVGLRFGTIVRIVKVVLVNAFKFMAATGKLMFNAVILIFETGFRGALIGIIFLIKKLTGLVGDIVSFFSDEAAKGIRKFEKAADDAQDAQTRKLKERFATQATLVKEQATALKRVTEDAVHDTAQGIRDALEANKSAKSFEEFIKDGVESAKGGVVGLLGDLGLGDAFGFEIGDATVEQARSLSEVLAEIPPSIGKANSGLKNFSSSMKKLEEDALATREALDLGRATRGAAGGADQAKILLQQQQRIRKDTLKIDQEIQNARARLVGIGAKQVANSARVAELEDSTQKAVVKGVEVGLRAAQVRRDIATATQEAAVAQIKQRRAAAAFDQEEALNQGDLLSIATDKVKVLQAELKVINEKADALTSGLEPELASKVNALIAGRISLAGQELHLNEDILALLEARRDVEKTIAEVFANRLILSAENEAARLTGTLAGARAELETLRETFALRGSLNDLEVRAAEARGDESIQRVRVEQLKQEQVATLALLDQNISMTSNEEARNALIAQRKELIEANAAALELEQEYLDQAAAKTQAINDIAESPVKFGALQAIANFGKDAQDSFKTTLQVMTTLLDGVANIWNDIIASALDPSKGPVDILAKFQQLLNQIVQQILNAFLKAQLAKLMFNVFGFSPGDLATLGLGAVTGGAIPAGDRRAQPSPAHAFAHGYVEGGQIQHKAVRPRGLDPRDTEPIWAQPGEHMQPVKRVKQYGMDLLESIRRGIADPAALRAAAGLAPRATRRLSVPSSAGLVEGGVVGKGLAAAQSGGSRPKIVNVVSPELIQNELVSDQGEEAILNVIRANQEDS